MTEIISLQTITEVQEAKILKTLQEGRMIAYPTDTIYGIGVDVFNSDAVDSLIRLKGRSSKKPISVLYSDVIRLLADFQHLTNYQKKVVTKLLPGRITLVLPVGGKLFPRAFLDEGWIGIRVIGLKSVNRILRKYPHPISTTSINPSGSKPAENVDEIIAYFGDSFPIIIDGGVSKDRTSSTVIKVYNARYDILRLGAVTATEIEKKVLTE